MSTRCTRLHHHCRALSRLAAFHPHWQQLTLVCNAYAMRRPSMRCRLFAHMQRYRRRPRRGSCSSAWHLRVDFAPCLGYNTHNGVPVAAVVTDEPCTTTSSYIFNALEHAHGTTLPRRTCEPDNSTRGVCVHTHIMIFLHGSRSYTVDRRKVFYTETRHSSIHIFYLQ